ncbi:MAG: hypothetical protein EXX96DRAFT_110210 [Benjaminiella poitrasii]|nr:MAG: hypothetical protein EXX96DRAFT_116822 [Benjaminiella poitrasii]KAI9468249.1 MAG: hypothetical protein EXX96DRAFT_110210 [Benjaminiella poitrasii]
MPGHVVYACNCLNVRIHLANKYYLEGHEDFRKDKFTRLEDPHIAGWKFELSMKGVIIEYTSLIRLRYIMDNLDGWVTISCHNCSTGDVYSVRRQKKPKIIYPIQQSILSQSGDQVIIHKGTIFGTEIEKLQKKATYSNTFHVILNPDLPINQLSLEKEEEVQNDELMFQYKEVKDLLKQSLKDLEEKTEKRIQDYREEQEILLMREKQKAMYDGAILWQTMKEISRTINEEYERVRRLSLQRTKHGLSDQILFNCIISNEQNNHVNDATVENNECVLKSDPLITEDAKPSSMRRSSSSMGFKRNLPFKNSPIDTSYDRLSASANATNSKKKNPSGTATSAHEMPPFLRRRSLLVPKPEEHYSLHPLANSAEEQTNGQMSVSSTSSSWIDEDDDADEQRKRDESKKDREEDDEDLFPLDEDIEQ